MLDEEWDKRIGEWKYKNEELYEELKGPYNKNKASIAIYDLWIKAYGGKSIFDY